MEDAATALHPAAESSPLAANGKYNEVHFDAIDRDVLAADLAERAWQRSDERTNEAAHPDDEPHPDFTPTTLERTYLEAKTGASQVGDVHATGRLFY